jgi:hypothetical protein
MHVPRPGWKERTLSMRKCLKPLVMGAVVLGSVQAAFADGILPGPFGFRFFTEFLSAVFLYPFQIAGC